MIQNNVHDRERLSYPHSENTNYHGFMNLELYQDIEKTTFELYDLLDNFVE